MFSRKDFCAANPRATLSNAILISDWINSMDHSRVSGNKCEVKRSPPPPPAP